MGKLDIKIDFSKLKKINFGALKAYTAMLWPAAIVLAGVVVLTAAILMGRSFRAKVQRESIPLDTEIKTLSGTATPAAQVEVEKQYQDAYQRDANEIEKLAIESTQRELLDYGLFPQPKETSTMIFTAFGKTFRQQLERLAASINGRDCPSEDEIKVLMQKGTNTPSYMTMSTSNKDQERIMEELYQARAKTLSIYINPEDISGYDFWGDYQYKNHESAVLDCWRWQIGYWIIEDVISAVKTMNANSGLVSTSPVKRIERIGFLTPEKLYGQSAGSGVKAKADQTMPKYVIKPEDQLTESCTARISNEDVNIVHFSVIAVIETKHILPFMKELCSVKEHKWKGYFGNEPEKVFKHNQITILESRIRPVSPESEDHKKYRYGPSAASEVDLICEYIFCKKGYENINPELYKKQEAAKPQEQQPQPQEGPGGPGFGPGPGGPG